MQKHFGCQACQPGGCNGGMCVPNTPNSVEEMESQGTRALEDRDGPIRSKYHRMGTVIKEQKTYHVMLTVVVCRI